MTLPYDDNTLPSIRSREQHYLIANAILARRCMHGVLTEQPCPYQATHRAPPGQAAWYSCPEHVITGVDAEDTSGDVLLLGKPQRG